LLTSQSLTEKEIKYACHTHTHTYKHNHPPELYPFRVEKKELSKAVFYHIFEASAGRDAQIRFPKMITTNIVTMYSQENDDEKIASENEKKKKKYKVFPRGHQETGSKQ